MSQISASLICVGSLILLEQAVSYLLLSLVVYAAALKHQELHSLARLLAFGSAASIKMLYVFG